jgi:hypothetical protein
MVTEILAQIRGDKFYAGIVLWDGHVVEAAPIVGYMKRGKWTRERVRDYCRQKGWKISVVHETKHPGYGNHHVGRRSVGDTLA